MTTDEFRLYHEQTFDSFSKRVIKHIAIDIHNAEAALSKVEVPLSTLPYSEATKLAAEDTYDLGDDVCVRFDLLGIPIEVHDPALGQALSSLPPKRRDVVLLFYFADQNEPQIGKLLNITTMAVNSRRRKALAALRELLEVVLLDNFVSRGMVVDFAIHSPDKEDGGIQNPHFHVMCPIRPIEPNGKWGNKQRREYVLDEDGNRIRDEAGNYVFNAVPTTDWGKPETLEFWREQWAELCNAKFAEKDLDCRIDHRSFERQGVEQIPTQHEGPTVRAMEAKGICTNKGDLNRWIRKTNAMLREAKQKIAALIDWLKEVKAELSKPQPPTLVELLSAYYDNRNKGAYSSKAKIANLKKMSEAVSYLEAKGLYTADDLDAALHTMQDKIDTLKKSASGKQTRIKELDELLRMADYYKAGKPVADKLKTIRFEKSRQKYKAEHDDTLRLFYMAERKLKGQLVDGKLPVAAWRAEKARLETEYRDLQQELSPLYADTKKLWAIHYNIYEVQHEQERQNAVTRQKKQEIEH